MSLDPLALILAALATYRLARMVTQEEGPLDIFVKLRGAIDPDQKTWLGRGINCALCVGFWVSLGVAFLLAPFDWSLLLIWWGIAGAQILIQKWEYRR